jgi:hypothetical protein
VNAEGNHFDISLVFPAVEASEVFEVSLKYSLQGYKEQDFKIRNTNPQVCIVDELDQCVPSFATWNLTPSLSNVIRVKVTGNFVGAIPLSFEVQNIKTGETYLTSERLLWKKGYYSNYIKHLNERVMAESAMLVESTESHPDGLYSKYDFFVLAPLLFCVPLVLGLLTYKMIKSRNESN